MNVAKNTSKGFIRTTKKYTMRRYMTWKCLSVAAGSLGCGVLLTGRRGITGSVSADAPAQDPGRPPPDRSQDDLTLRCVQIYFRHGARTPLRHIPNVDEVTYKQEFLMRTPEHTATPVEVRALDGGPRPRMYLDEHYIKTTFQGGCSAGQLTALGKDQAYLLGKRLKRRYHEVQQLIEEHYNPGEVIGRSTNVNRCVQSLQCVIAGLYGVQSFNNRDPAVISVAPFPQETLFPNLHYCSTLNMLQKKVSSNEGAIPGWTKIRDKINAIIGHDGSLDLMQWRDHIVAREAHGLQVPAFMLELRQEIEAAAVETLVAYMCGLPEDRTLVLQLGIGSLLYALQDKFEQTLAGASKGKMYLFCCHDSSLVPLLVAIGAYDNKWPPYTADIAFELLEDKCGKFWVRVLYCDKELILNGQSKALIPLSTFKEILEPYSLNPVQYAARCHDAKLARKHAAHWDEILSSPSENDDEIETPRNM